LVLHDEAQASQVRVGIPLSDDDVHAQVGLDDIPAGPVAFGHLASQADAIFRIGGVLEGLGGLAAFLHYLGQPDFVLGCQERVLADAIQVTTDGLAVGFTLGACHISDRKSTRLKSTHVNTAYVDICSNTHNAVQ